MKFVSLALVSALSIGLSKGEGADKKVKLRGEKDKLFKEDKQFWSRLLQDEVESLSLTPTCDAPPYEPLDTPASCGDLTFDSDHPNAYWELDQYQCRMSERPCVAFPFDGFVHVQEPSEDTLALDLGDNGSEGTLYFESDVEEGNGGGEVWIVYADEDGNPLPGSDSCARFRAEGREFKLPEDEESSLWDVNDYEPGSLDCCGPRDDDDRLYIVIDGVLVDSCPKRVIESCTDCP